jgi:hypothetical protein
MPPTYFATIMPQIKDVIPTDQMVYIFLGIVFQIQNFILEIQFSYSDILI